MTTKQKAAFICQVVASNGPRLSEESPLDLYDLVADEFGISRRSEAVKLARGSFFNVLFVDKYRHVEGYEIDALAESIIRSDG